MGKQTMGTPSTSLNHRTDNKLYRLQSGQSPLVRPKLHKTYAMDSFPNGTNAVVAVISYTGYDMEDAMILNKSVHERGFGYGTVYKSQIIDLKETRGASKSSAATHAAFWAWTRYTIGTRKISSTLVATFSMWMAFPSLEQRLMSGDFIAAYVDDTTGRTCFVKYKGDETAYVDQVRLLGKHC
jgi:DNA-directed RNA polymerase I subunit RPA2